MNGSRPGIFRRFGPELLVLGLAAALVVVARGRWVSSLGDYGIWYSDLEAMGRGQRVMRDIYLPYGPLSLAVLYAVVGPFPETVATVAAAEFTIGLIAALGIVRYSALFLRPRERCVAAAALATLVFWIPGEGGLLYPYTPAVSIGFLFVLSALSVAVMARKSDSGAPLAAVAGLLAGLAYLTKQEMGAAAALGVAAAWIIGERWTRVIARGATGSAVFLATVAAGYGIALRGLPFRTAIAAVRSLWPFSPIPHQWRAQYAGVTGADRPVEAALAVISAVGAGVAVVAGAALLSSMRRDLGRQSRPILVALLAGAGTWALAGRFQRIAVFAAVPVAVAGALVYGFLRRREPGRDRAIALAAMSAAALPLLTRVGWRGWSDSPFTAIGYSLAVPVTVFVISRLFFWFRKPSTAGSHDDFGWAGTIALVSLIVLLALPALLRVGRWPEPVVVVPMPRGAVFVPPGWGKSFGAVRDFVAASTGSEESVLFLPQSHGLNFLLKRGSPSPGLKLDPSFDERGETDLIRTMANRPPALVVEFDENAQIYDSGGYGTKYGRQLDRWIESRYRVVSRSRQSEIGFRILKRQDRGSMPGAERH